MGQKEIIERKFSLALQGHVDDARYFFFDTDPRKKYRLAIIFGGFEKCAPDFEIKRKTYPYYVIEIALKGNCSLAIGENHGQLKRGIIAGFCPRQSHHYIFDKNNPREHIFIAFTGSQAKRLMNQSGLEKTGIIKLEKPGEIIYLAQAILKSGLEKTEHSHELCCNYLKALLLEQSAGRARGDKTASASTSTYRQCRKYIDENFSSIFLPSTVAAHCRINTRYMSRLFKKYAGISPHEYIMRLKLNRAANILSVSSTPIKEVAETVGFIDPYHFSRNFKQFHGVSPKDYRDRLREN